MPITASKKAAGFTCVCVTVTITAISVFILSIQTTSAQECHSIVGPEALDLLSTKRPYRFNLVEAAAVPYTPEGCEAEKLWYFGRHGTRYPGSEDIVAMQNLLPGLFDEIVSVAKDSSLCPPTVSYFSSWTPRSDLNVSTESYLTTQGIYELNSISTRFISRYPQLFPSQFTNQTYFFKFTDAQRTKASAHAYASSIFGTENLDTVYFPAPLSKDPILKFYSLCTKWEEEVDKNPAGSKEHDEFTVSTVMNSTIARVSSRLGLRRNITLDEIVIMYTTCAFETAWNNGSLSQWCALFDLEDLRVMEYMEDLDYYWKDGPGFEINYEQACSPFKDAMEFLDDPKGKSVTAYFSHSGATLKMFARLGLFNGSSTSEAPEIRADNYEQMKSRYEWRTSEIDCMGTNMAFVKYNCPGSSPNKQIGLFTQEMPTPFSACGGKAFCDYEEFKSRMGVFTDNCDLNEICRV